MHSKVSLCLAAAVALLSSVANAHMKLKSPVPLNPDSLDNSPLNADGSNFPCKNTGVAGFYDFAKNTVNKAAIGQPQTLSFIGSAVHGGGSCQISLTTDPNPTNATKWMVIHSIEGGCPAKNVAGNLPENANGDDPDTYQFTIPDGIAPGNYIMSWSWFNKIGNLEMYQNCAAYTVTAGSKKRGIQQRKANSRALVKRTDFPDMFVANVGPSGNNCATDHSNGGSDVIFPNPGTSVDKFGDPSALKPPVGNCKKGSVSAPASGISGASGSGSSSNGSSGGASASAAAPAATSAAAGGESATGGVFNQPATFTSSVVATPIPSSTPAAAPSAAPPAASPPASPLAGGANSSGTTSSAGALSGACTQEGMWNCIGGSSFQRCASGAWSPATPMASGTTCTGGQSMDMAIAKRDIRNSAAHLRRHKARMAGGF